MSAPAYRYERLYEVKTEYEVGGASVTQRRFFMAPDLDVATRMAVEHLSDGETLIGVSQLFSEVVAYA